MRVIIWGKILSCFFRIWISLGLQEKIAHQDDRRFYLFKVLRAHILPLTFVAFNKAGSVYDIGFSSPSGDRSFICDLDSSLVRMIERAKYGILHRVKNCILLKDIRMSSMRLHSIILMGRYSFTRSLSNLFVSSSDKIATGSFDKTACIWSTERGTCYHTLRGHTGEIVC